jgi:peptidoglycan hydrolase CwlO-like protein
VKELYFEEFQKLLAQHFKNVRFLGQRIHPSSSIWPIDAKSDAGVQEIVIDRGESEFQFISNDKRVALYFIAIASDSLASIAHPGSVLVDHSDALIRESTKAIEWRDQQLSDRDRTISSLQDAVKWREEQISANEKTIASLEEAIKWREDQIKSLEEQMKSLNEGLTWTQTHLTEMKQTVASHEEALAWRAHQVETLEREKTDLISILQTTQRQLNFASEQLEAIYASSGWKFILRIRHFRDGLRRLMGLGASRGQQ